MSLRVIMVTGPRRAGKSTLIQDVVKEVCSRQPHFIRLAASTGSKREPRCARPDDNCGVATASWVNYDPERVFEQLPAILHVVQQHDRNACVIIEADTDPLLRHAYPYDCQVFVMAAPRDLHEVFRTPAEARAALQNALADTGVFASEIFGCTGQPEGNDDDSATDRSMSDTQMLRLMHSPLGHELASRIQCQPAYHGAIESDVVIVNTGVGGTDAEVDEAVRRLEGLVHRSIPGAHRPVIFCCDLQDPRDPRRSRLFEALRSKYQHLGPD